MGKIWMPGGGGGGDGSDECTATRAEVLKGYKAITKESGDEAAEGTLELTGTAADSQVLSGQTYYNTDAKQKRTGGMPNRGAVSQSLNAGGSYTIPAGYHNGGGRVTANNLASQTSGTANASQILTGKTAYVNGSKLTGTMAHQGAKTASLNCGGSYTIPAGYHNGSGRVTANSLVSQTGGVTADDTKVLSGYTYWRDGVKRTGNLIITSAVSFSVAQYASLTMIASWANPSKGPWSGLYVVAKQGSYPANAGDGTCVYNGSGTYATFALPAGYWYFVAWNYINTNHGTLWGSALMAACNNVEIKGQQVYTSSGIFTVPSGVRTIQIFCVGGGGGGHCGFSGGTSGDCGGGGGGGYTTTSIANVTPGQQLKIIVGTGGSSTSGNPGNIFGSLSGGSSAVYNGTIELCRAEGGKGAGNNGTGNGGGGGSGGGGGGYGDSNHADGNHPGRNGGADGNDGDNYLGGHGSGQHTTTRAFRESWNTVYAGGGGGGAFSISTSSGVGGEGGGGNGSHASYGGGTPGAEGTGGGGGGGHWHRSNPGVGFAGGSGIVILRWGY